MKHVFCKAVWMIFIAASLALVCAAPAFATEEAVVTGSSVRILPEMMAEMALTGESERIQFLSDFATITFPSDMSRLPMIDWAVKAGALTLDEVYYDITFANRIKDPPLLDFVSALSPGCTILAAANFDLRLRDRSTYAPIMAVPEYGTQLLHTMIVPAEAFESALGSECCVFYCEGFQKRLVSVPFQDRPLENGDVEFTFLGGQYGDYVVVALDPDVALPFSDVDPDSEAYHVILTAWQKKYIAETEDGLFVPDEVITRAQLIQMFYDVYGPVIGAYEPPQNAKVGNEPGNFEAATALEESNLWYGNTNNVPTDSEVAWEELGYWAYIFMKTFMGADQKVTENGYTVIYEDVDEDYDESYIDDDDVDLYEYPDITAYGDPHIVPDDYVFVDYLENVSPRYLRAIQVVAGSSEILAWNPEGFDPKASVTRAQALAVIMRVESYNRMLLGQYIY